MPLCVRLGLLAITALAAAVPSAAFGCSVIYRPERSHAERVDEARALIERADAIIDGEVVRAFERGRRRALVRPARIFKGPPLQSYEVGEESSCDLALVRVGERRRLVLFGGPDVWRATMIDADAPIVDRLLGSDRRRDWPYFAGVGEAVEPRD